MSNIYFLYNAATLVKSNLWYVVISDWGWTMLSNAYLKAKPNQSRLISWESDACITHWWAGWPSRSVLHFPDLQRIFIYSLKARFQSRAQWGLPYIYNQPTENSEHLTPSFCKGHMPITSSHKAAERKENTMVARQGNTQLLMPEE